MVVVVPPYQVQSSATVLAAWNDGSDFTICTGMMQRINKPIADCAGITVFVIFADYSRYLIILPK